MNKTLGIIGGGQLGKMIALSAKAMGFIVATLDPDPDCPAKGVSDIFVESSFDNPLKLSSFCQKCDFVTYEFENIPYRLIEGLEKKFNIPQGHKPLYYSQNRLVEKNAALNLGIKTAKFLAIKSYEELISKYQEIGLPAVLKTIEGGYDGHGQVVLRNETDLENGKKLLENQECILEEFLVFEKELSIISARSTKGETAFFPVSENVHKDNILFTSTVPANISKEIEQEAKKIASKVLDGLSLIGTLAIEFFLKDGTLYFNEMAPRPHNSGHYTIEGCETSQFEQHVRSVTGMTLGNTKLIQPTVMINLLGDDVKLLDKLSQTKAFKDIKIHLYGKKSIRHKRKMGHLTFINYNLEESLKIYKENNHE
ncbi:MAG: 5-(carboxyamino)imidazole ribonucleotide synthase [Erysipelotrichales bacterium]|nr:5-(carboxyamino)imidazole ribonucleotide synthase [Erysipelotrichales bacterium]